ncbi:MAG: Fic family protein [Lachnospiraceae bacterium]|nr:Fic family protein [Lachnospiraceae bacterium]
MEYKILERDAKLGVYSAAKKLRQRQEKLEMLPIRDAFGYQLSWCPGAIPDGLLSDINKMYDNISVTDIDTDISIEKESFHSCRIEGADTSVEELFDIFRAKRTEKKGDRMILNTYRAVKYLNLTSKRNVDTLVRLWEIVTDGVCDNPDLSGSKFRTGVVTVGTHEAPDVEFLDYCMKQFFGFYNGGNIECPYIKVAIVHFYFVYMHPFCDGNGRIARLLTSDFLIRSGLYNFSALTLSKTINETAPDYYQAIENSENSFHDVTPFIQYMLKTVYDNLYEVLEGQGRYVVKHTDWGKVFV